tara:strand:+ start:320 stop:505 length:186 start_codon:yes stop_codon:yes gene_type:complete
MWTLVFIYLYEGISYSETYDTYNKMTDCFYAREALGQENSGTSGHFIPGTQAVCVYMGEVE